MSVPFQPKRVLVTGANGFVGTYLSAAIAPRWPDAKLFSLGKSAELNPDIIAADLLDRAAIEAAVSNAQPDVVIHLAAQASVALGAQEAGDTWAVNVTGSLNLASAVASAAPDALVLFASSSEVYGASFRAGPASEETVPLPMNAYAKSKAIAERIFADVLPASAKLLIARPFNHTGPGQAETFVLPSFVAQVARIEKGRQPPQLDVGNLDVVRDFLNVQDVVEAYLMLVESTERLPRVFTCNIASETVKPLRDHVAILKSLAHKPFDIVVDPARMRPIDLPIAAGDAHLLRTVTGWAPRHDMAATLESMLEAARRST